MKNENTTSCIYNLDDNLLEPAKGYYKDRDRIYIDTTEDGDDGTWSRVSDYVKFCNKVDNRDYRAVQNFLVGKRKKLDCGEFILSKETIQYADGLMIEFKKPQKVVFGSYTKDNKTVLVTEEIKAVKGKLSHDFYYFKNTGRQDKIANGIELFIEELEFIS